MGNAFNIHNGKIPLFSGFNSLSHYIIEGRSEMITTLHQIEEVVDTGLVACEKKTKIQVSDTAFSLYEKTLPVIQDLFIFLLNSIHADSIKLYKPFRSRRRYFPRNSLEKYKCLNNLNNLIFIKRIVRALYFPPHPPAYLKIGLQKYYLVEESHFNQINSNSNNITLPDPY
jgi:methionyl-tRNA formyltransferase